MITYTIIIEDVPKVGAQVNIKVDSKDVKPSEEIIASHYAAAFKAVLSHNSGVKISDQSHPNN